ncbi:hypothetical protein K450DRAFT_220513 [Umbelopsis ramanniana AG]|uniref:Prokaryotic-type class I peptide chain release factors domain-containing protein n=1 Tax=Umbelopsis ramanniana AG TaxID=1314678 RepID=A0AAD5EIF9_UMBRA|nr:uncharacterized protein K450DRAFT_220513 [Umbelopsis ramanniana AG]KAI8583902.1 hypothetical protein K450DRAFT_220513 [Umbelopsis ramanniana AG]
MLRRLMFRRLYSTKPWTHAEASKWCKSFSKEQIPKSDLKITVSRSSGPGGQNVNKVNTKVDIRLGIKDAKWIPEYARIKILQEANVRTTKDGQLIMVSDRTRSQAKNLEDCMEKLAGVIRSAVQVPKDPDAETIQKVKQLEETAYMRRKDRKQLHSQKKVQRKSKGPDY